MKKAAFLDRDGVINIDHAYVHRFEDFDAEGFCRRRRSYYRRLFLSAPSKQGALPLAL